MNIVIIGGVASGAKAAAKVKRLLPHASVKIFTDDTHVSYSSCGLPYYIQGNFNDYTSLLVRSPEEFKASGIDVFLQSKVEKIFPEQKNVLVRNFETVELVPYDKLIIATGASPVRPKIKGIDDFENIFTVRKIEDGINIREKMLKSKNAVIIGGGYIGIEMLEAFSKNNVYTHLFERSSQIMPTLDFEMSEVAKKRLNSIENKNFELHTDSMATEFIGKDGVLTGVITSDGKQYECDLAIVCAGVKPNTELAKEAGIEIGETGAIKVNKLMRTSVEDIFACGDCAEKTHIVSGKKVWIPLGSTANKEGRCAAMNVAGVYCEFEGILGSMVTRCLNTTIAMTGLTEKEAFEIGFKPVSVVVSKYDKVAYMPDTGEITLKVVADKITGLLLGAQAVGSIGADKRVNTVTSGLIGHLTVEEFSNNDLTYSPAYSPTIDPLLNAMQILCNETARSC
ncbi:FAD-dependent oxidoreductase [bacterium]|nr:FAD-dependent oxidoreductase [bacterium]